MNVLFLSQAGGVNLFADLWREMLSPGITGRAGFYVADSASYRRFIAAQPDFEAGVDVVKEWEIQARARPAVPDLAKLKAYERDLGDALWNAVTADRRLCLGPGAVREQDYSSRFSHDTLLAILQTTCDELTALFDRVRPNLVVGFICVTIGEYIAYLIARRRGIRFVNLRPTRIRNYFYGGEDVFEPSARLEAEYRREMHGPDTRARCTAREILAQVRETHAMYEGVLPAANQAPAVASTAQPQPIRRESLASRLARMTHEAWAYNFGSLWADSHRANRLRAHWFHRMKKPWRLHRLESVLGRRYIRTPEALAKIEFAFFPLHKEPEVTLLVYARPWLNQIEAVRNVARSLPVGMKLVVKEHPAALGYRPVGYYRKLLRIPNVVLAAPELSSRDVLHHAKLVTIIGGSVGLEAMMLRLPVIALGNVPFQFLPPSMIRAVGNVHMLDGEIRELLAEHRHDEAALEAYVAAVVANSVPVDFYSVLLGRRGAYRPAGAGTDSNYSSQIGRLAAYVAAQNPYEGAADKAYSTIGMSASA